MGVLLVEEKALECQIAVMLRLIGVQPNVRGWRYIVDGVSWSQRTKSLRTT